MWKTYNKHLLRQYVSVIAVNFCTLVSGLSMAWSSPVLVKLRNSTEPVLSRPITEEEGSWIVSIGSITSIANKIGRKYGLILASLPRIIAGFVLVYASEVWMVLFARALDGCSDAIIFTTVPIYVAEISSKEVRGSLGTLLTIALSCGALIMLSVGPFLSYITLNVIFVCFIIFAAIPIFMLPDSPYSLYYKGRKEEALKVLLVYRGSEELARQELKLYEEISRTEKIVKKKEILTQRIFLKTLLLAVILVAAFQFTGFNAITPYLQTILESSHTSVRPETASIVIGIIQLCGSFGATFTTDKFGRKPVLSFSSLGMGLGMFGLGSFFKLKETIPITGLMKFLPIASLILIVFSFNAGIGTLLWLLAAELFDDKSRAIGMTIVNFSTALFMFPTTKCFALVTSTIGFAFTYWIFSVNCVLICLFIVFFIPETKGKSFTEIQDILRKKSDNDKCAS